MPRYTYTFVIGLDDECIWDYSIDSIEEGFKLAVEWLNKLLN